MVAASTSEERPRVMALLTIGIIGGLLVGPGLYLFEVAPKY